MVTYQLIVVSSGNMPGLMWSVGLHVHIHVHCTWKRYYFSYWYMYVYLVAIGLVPYSGDNFIDVRLAALKALVDIVQGMYQDCHHAVRRYSDI